MARRSLHGDSSSEAADGVKGQGVRGTVGLRARRRSEWDDAAFRITNLPAANALLTKVYRPGWGV